MEPKIIVVDDDPMILKRAWNILSEAGMKVVVLKNGEQLLDFISENGAPDLVLLDIHMPGMDGFDTLRKLRLSERGKEETPVIFLTAKEDEETEAKGLEYGAMDYIKKPFAASILVLRVRHAIELVHLQKDLANEVKKKTLEHERLFIHVVRSLADAIDAKDTYTNGHSLRVAKYSREIACRYGYDEKRQEELYMIGLLHDVGKIGVPDSIINKTDKLTDEEFEQIGRAHV